MKIVYEGKHDIGHVLAAYGTEAEVRGLAEWACREYDDDDCGIETLSTRFTVGGVAYDALTELIVRTETEAVRVMLTWG